jgi:molecular chaperone HscB
MNFFSFYEIEPCFFIDENLLRRKYLDYSRKYHPDFFGNDSDEKQMETLELSSLNNEAYKTLLDFEKRFAYILNLHGLLTDSGNKLEMPKEFLLEMMDLNEKIMELEYSKDQTSITDIQNEIEINKKNLWEAILPVLELYQFDSISPSDLNKILDYHLKSKYIKRLEDGLNARNPEI